MHITKTWLITGCSRGLGRALTEAALSAGHRVFATARKQEHIADLKIRFDSNVQTHSLDVRDFDAAEKAVLMAKQAFGSIDVLKNNAGFGNVGSVENSDLKEIRDQIETNLFGVIHVTKAVLPIMREQNYGHIIQISSVGGRIGAPGRAAYSASKWGVEGFSESLSKEVKPLGIKVSIIEPGGFRTDFAGSSTKIEEGHQAYKSTIGAVADFQRGYNGNQPGDPVKAAAAIIFITTLSDPPLRLPLGSDAVRIVEEAEIDRFEADKHWRTLGISTDFPEANAKKNL